MRIAVRESLRTCLSPFCGSSVYKQQCPLDIYKGCNVILQCIHKAVNHHSTCTCLLLLMWFFCPSALTAAPLLIESSHDKIKAFYCCAFFCHKAPHLSMCSKRSPRIGQGHMSCALVKLCQRVLKSQECLSRLGTGGLCSSHPIG